MSGSASPKNLFNICLSVFTGRPYKPVVEAALLAVAGLSWLVFLWERQWRLTLIFSAAWLLFFACWHWLGSLQGGWWVDALYVLLALYWLVVQLLPVAIIFKWASAIEKWNKHNRPTNTISTIPVTPEIEGRTGSNNNRSEFYRDEETGKLMWKMSSMLEPVEINPWSEVLSLMRWGPYMLLLALELVYLLPADAYMYFSLTHEFVLLVAYSLPAIGEYAALSACPDRIQQAWVLAIMLSPITGLMLINLDYWPRIEKNATRHPVFLILLSVIIVATLYGIHFISPEIDSIEVSSEPLERVIDLPSKSIYDWMMLHSLETFFLPMLMYILIYGGIFFGVIYQIIVANITARIPSPR